MIKGYITCVGPLTPLIAALAVVAVCASAQAQVTVSSNNSSATFNLPGHSATGTVEGVSSLLRNTPFAGGVDEIQDVDSQGIGWYLGVDTNLAAEISALGVTGSDVFSTAGTRVDYSYGAGGTTEVVGSYFLADPPGPTLAPQSDTTGNFHAALFMGVSVINNDNVAHTYSLYSFHDLALTDVVSGTGFDAIADERLVVGGTNTGAGIDNNLITRTDFDSTHPLFSQSTIRVIAPGDVNGDLKITLNPDIQTVLANNADTVPGSDGVTLPTPITPYEDYLAFGDTNLDGIITLNPDIQITLANNAVQRSKPDFVQVHQDNASLIDGFIKAATNLNNTTSVDPAGSQTGETLTSAFQWTFTLQPGETFDVDELLIVSPEPGSLALLGLGATLLMGRRRRR